jgi:hypothetical protein
MVKKDSVIFAVNVRSESHGLHGSCCIKGPRLKRLVMNMCQLFR